MAGHRAFLIRAGVLGCAAALALTMAACDKPSPGETPGNTGAATNAGTSGGGGEYVLGAIVPSSGPFAEWGKGNTVALQLLEKVTNDAGGINGNKVRFVIYDDSANPAQAASLVRKLAGQDKALAIAGPLTSSAAEVAFPVANSQKLVSVSQASSKPGVAEANRPFAFRNTVDEQVLGSSTVKFWKEKHGLKTAVIIYDSKDATAKTTGTAIFPKLLEANGITLLNKDNIASFQTGDVDVSGQVTALKALNPDGVVIGADYSQAVSVMREMKKQGFAKPVLSSSQMIASASLQAYPEISITAPATYYVGAPEDAAKKFTDGMKEGLKAAGLGDIEPTMYDANIYEIGMMFIDAIKKENIKPGDLEAGRTAIQKHLEQLSDFNGLIDSISFNKNGDAVKKFFILEGKNGEWSPEMLCESGENANCAKP